MMYLNPTPNPSGAYPAPQSNPFPGAIELTDEQAATLVEYNGFVTVTQEEETVSIAPNAEAWEAWKAEQAELPEPEPAEEPVTWSALAAAIKEGVNEV